MQTHTPQQTKQQQNTFSGRLPNYQDLKSGSSESKLTPHNKQNNIKTHSVVDYPTTKI